MRPKLSLSLFCMFCFLPGTSFTQQNLLKIQAESLKNQLKKLSNSQPGLI